jgi:hypothetical protein
MQAEGSFLAAALHPLNGRRAIVEMRTRMAMPSLMDSGALPIGEAWAEELGGSIWPAA